MRVVGSITLPAGAHRALLGKVYSGGTVLLEGTPITVLITPREPFRMRGLILLSQEADRSTLWLRNLLWSLSWFRIPWPVRDPDFPEDRLWHWRSVSLHLAERIRARAQRRALAQVRVDDIRVGNVRIFASPAPVDYPAAVFEEGVDNLDASCGAGQPISITLSGVGQPTVLVRGLVQGPYQEKFPGIPFEESDQGQVPS